MMTKYVFPTLMKQLHPLSFILGIVSGILILLLVAGGLRLVYPNSSAPARSGTQWTGQGAPQGQRLQRVADTLGMNVADLQKELDSGKTLQDIATEHGKELPAGGPGRMGGNSSVTTSASGTTVSENSSASSISSK